MKFENLISVVVLAVFLGALTSEATHAMFSSGVYDLAAVGLYLLLGIGAVVLGCTFGVAFGALRPVTVMTTIVKEEKCQICEAGQRAVQSEIYHSKPSLDTGRKIGSRRRVTVV